MKYAKVKKISDLKRGEIILHRGSAVAYVVTGCYGDRVTAVRTVDVTHTSEWEVLITEDQKEDLTQPQQLPPPCWPEQPF